jgi:Pentapeptide repeats (8 copies)
VDVGDHGPDGSKQAVLDGFDSWHAYWTAQGMPWRTQPQLDGARQRFLAERRAVQPDIEQGIYPFRDESGAIRLTRADVEWLAATHEDNGVVGPADLHAEQVQWSAVARLWRPDEFVAAYERVRWAQRRGPDLRGADLAGVDLRRLPLARAGLRAARLVAADLREADLRQAVLHDADLRQAIVCGADASDARLDGTGLSDADLSEANLCSAGLHGAILRGATCAPPTWRMPT